MPTQTKTEVEIKLTQEQSEKIKEATGLAVEQLRINVGGLGHDGVVPPRPILECIVTR